VDLIEALAHIELLTGVIAAHEATIAQRDETIRSIEFELQHAKYQIARFRHGMYGDRSERTPPEMLTLPGIDMTPVNDTIPEEPPRRKGRRNRKGIKRTKKNRDRLELNPSCVNNVDKVVDCAKDCPTCQCEMEIIGFETHVRVEREKPRYTRTTTKRIKRACGHCKEGVHIAAAEDHATGNGIMGPSLVVDTAVMHFHDHLPFNRITEIYKREGMTVERSTLSRATSRLANALRIIAQSMEDEMLASDGVLGIDGTGVKIFASPHCTRRSIYVVHGLGHVVYRVLKSDNAANVLEGFKDFKGVVESDAAKVHTGTLSVSYGLKVALCNAHARRKFKEARETDRQRADHALRFYQHIAREEKKWRNLEPEERKKERIRVLQPRFDAFKIWLTEEREQLMGRSPMAGAFDYMLGHWDGLTLFLTDGRVPWTNNESERLLRHIVVGRKAWVFRGTFRSTEQGCILWALMMSCRMHGVDPRRYLLDTIAALDVTPASRVLELTPREYARRLRANTEVAKSA
jgi:transposase